MADPQPLNHQTPPPRRSWLARPVAVIVLAILGLGLVVAVLMPPTSRHGDFSPRAQCASDEHQIGLAILLYQQDNAQRYPPSLADLVADEQIGPSVFACPSSNDVSATLPPNPTTRQVAAAWATPGHESYLYFGNTNWTDKTVKDDTIVLAEPPADHGGGGSNVLFGDGHADWIPMPRAARLIAAASATTRPVSAASVP
jgi:prepilin-type processing-associated H-X9-DG protein